MCGALMAPPFPTATGCNREKWWLKVPEEGFFCDQIGDRLHTEARLRKQTALLSLAERLTAGLFSWLRVSSQAHYPQLDLFPAETQVSHPTLPWVRLTSRTTHIFDTPQEELPWLQAH